MKKSATQKHLTSTDPPTKKAQTKGFLSVSLDKQPGRDHISEEGKLLDRYSTQLNITEKLIPPTSAMVKWGTQTSTLVRLSHAKTTIGVV